MVGTCMKQACFFEDSTGCVSMCCSCICCSPVVSVKIVKKKQPQKCESAQQHGEGKSETLLWSFGWAVIKLAFESNFNC
jgi:hypothetical protein